jgi:dTDP-D-glucose 4,6-dehydratase
MAKRIGENVAEWYHQEQGLNVVRVRPSNIFGPHDYFDDRAHVIPALIKKCLEQDPVQVYGTGLEEREFIYVTGQQVKCTTSARTARLVSLSNNWYRRSRWRSVSRKT